MWCKDSLSHRLCYIQSSPEHHPQDCSAGSQADHTDWEFLASTSRGDTQGATTVLLWAQGKSHLTKTLAWGSQSSLPSQLIGGGVGTFLSWELTVFEIRRFQIDVAYSVR